MTKSQLGYSILSDSMLRQMMGNVQSHELDPFDCELLEEQLVANGVPADYAKRITGDEYEGNFWSPPLLGDNVAEHYELMAKEFLGDGNKLANLRQLINARHIVKPPADVLLQCRNRPGWTRLIADDGNWSLQSVPSPIEPVLYFDTETFVQGSPFAMPIIATALSHCAAYVWMSPQLADPTGKFDFATATLPPLGKNKIGIAHNSAYDSTRVIERYQLHNPSELYFLCTMSMQQVCAGLDSGQRWAYQKYGSGEWSGNQPRFLKHGTGKSLLATWNFWVARREGRDPLHSDKKSVRNIFVRATSLDEIRDSLDVLLPYAMDDVWLMHEFMPALWRAYLQQCPSLVPLAAHMLLSTSLMPIANDWHEWAKHVQTTWDADSAEIALILRQVAEHWHTEWQQGRLNPSEDPWLSQLDWKFKLDVNGQKFANWFLACGMGHWLKAKSDQACYLLRLTWYGKPMRRLKGKGWCYTDLSDELLNSLSDADMTRLLASLGKDEWLRIPHRTGVGKNVGAAISINYWDQAAAGDFASALPDDMMLDMRYKGEWTKREAKFALQRLMWLQQMLSYWIGYKGRVLSQPIGQTMTYLGKSQLVCAPQVVPHNTVSLRTGEPTYLTLAAHTIPKNGSELKAKLGCAPAGYKIVSYDLDSCELQMAGAMADSYLGISGSTPIGFSTIAGTKDAKTDLHTLVALAAGVGRNAAKQSNYAIVYGAGAKTVANTFKMWHPELDDATIGEFAKNTLLAMKGRRDRTANRFYDGTASQTFNKMLDLIARPEPHTDMLGTRMAPAMWPANSGDNGSPGQLNWLIQSSGSAMLHCTVLHIWWLRKRFQLLDRVGFGVSVHDEFVTYARTDVAKLWAYLLQIGHCWAWCLFHYKLKLYDMPALRAFASGISIDKIWRKDPSANVDTPTYKGPKAGIAMSMSQLVADGMSDKTQALWHSLHPSQLAKELVAI